MSILRRAAWADLEVRSDQRTIVGLAAPFDEPADIGPYVETIKPGAFARTIAERGDRVKLLALHDDRSLPLGRATALHEDARGLIVEARVSKTHAGDEALALVADGALDGLSVGFFPVRDRWTADRTAVDRLEVRLVEISLVTTAAYESARVLAVRQAAPAGPVAHLDPTTWATRLRVRPDHRTDPSAWAARLGLHP